jgi:uncharacterized repeat protein (TIGR01451 family)
LWLLPLVLLLVMLTSLLPLLPGAPQEIHPPAAEARIVNGSQPSVASAVDCIRPGQNPGDSPQFLTTCFASLWTPGYRSYNRGAGEPLYPGDAPATEPALVIFGDTKQASTADATWPVGQDGPWEFKASPAATVGQIGTVYGLAWASGRNPNAANGGREPRAYVSAFTKRVTRFGDGGPGAIYLRPWTANPTPQLFVTIPDVVNGPNGAAFDFGGPDASGVQRATFPNGGTATSATVWMGGVHLFEEDGPAITEVGRTSLGDLELDPNERFLYTVNLNNKLVYQVDTWSTNPQATVTPLPGVVPALNPCSSRGGVQNYRPFGLTVTRDFAYLGGVCSAETFPLTTDGERAVARAALAARVDRLPIDQNGNVIGGWQNVLGFGLDAYDTQRTFGTSRDLRWQPWQADQRCGFDIGNGLRQCPQPILADLAFDERGNLILGFRDRYGDVTGTRDPVQRGIPAGDILLARANGAGGWSQPATGAPDEHFDDRRTYVYDSPDKQEVASGALAYVPGSSTGAWGGEVVTSWLDPYLGSSFGTAWFNVASGGRPTNLQVIYDGAAGPSYLFDKSAGLGDIELQCVWSVIGDRVWNDANGNGVQDSGERGINGVRVQLFAGNDTRYTTPLQTVTTGDVDGDGQGGEYRFYVSPWQEYRVRLDPQQFQPGQAFANWRMTVANQGGDDTRDSDAHPIYRDILTTAPGNTEQDTTQDIGITQLQPTGVLGDQVWHDLNRNGVQDGGEPGMSNIPVELWVCDDINGVDCTPGSPFSRVRTATTNAAGLYEFRQIPANFYLVRFPSIPPGFVLTTANAGGDDSRDSDVALGTDWASGVLTILPNSVDTTQDMGLVATNSDIRVTLYGPAQVDADTLAPYTVGIVGGTSPMQNVTVQVTLPAPVRDVSASNGGTVSGSTITWTLPTLAAGATEWRTFGLIYPQVGTYTPRVDIASNPPDTDVANNSAQTTTRAVSTNLALDIIAPASIAPDQTFTYRITVSNRETQRGGTIPSTFLRGLYGPDLEYDYTSETVITLPSSIEVRSGSTWRRLSRMTFYTQGMGPGASQAFDITARLRPGLSPVPTTMSLSGRVDNAPNESRPTPDTRSDETQTVVTTVRYPDLVVDISADRATAGAGSRITYAVDTRNIGQEAAQNTTLVVTMPAGVTIGTPDRGGAAISGRTLTWNLGTLAAGTSAGTIRIPVTVEAGSVGTIPATITARAEATTTTPEPNVPNVDTVDVTLIPPPTVPPTLDVPDGLRLAIHSELDPLSNDGSDANAVYRSTGAAITWPAGEVLDFTPRASIELPAMSVEEDALYEYRARIDRWSVVSFGDGRQSRDARSASDVFERSGCRAPATTTSGLAGCAYPYIGGQDATQEVSAQRMPTETEMRGQAHVLWAANGPTSMSPDVYVWRIRGLEVAEISVQVLVRVDVVSRDTGAVVQTENRVLTQTYPVTLVAPRSVR